MVMFGFAKGGGLGLESEGMKKSSSSSSSKLFERLSKGPTERGALKTSKADTICESFSALPRKSTRVVNYAVENGIGFSGAPSETSACRSKKFMSIP